MKIYIVSLCTGLLVGAIYSLLHVRSPAPPVMALIGLLGILVGEQAVPVCRWLVGSRGIEAAHQHLFGEMPSAHTPNPPGGEIRRAAKGNPAGLLLAKPNAGILYATLARGPKLPAEYQMNSPRHFMRGLNRLGVTGVIDAGGGMQGYPEDYQIIQKLADDDLLTVRLAYNLFTQKPKEDFLRWTKSVTYRQGADDFRHNGAGEMLVFSAADFEDFREPGADLDPGMEDVPEELVRILAENRCAGRMHATCDQTISRALDVLEKVTRDIPLTGINWFFDHAETISERSIDRIAVLGGGVAVQHRMACPEADISSTATAPARQRRRRRWRGCWRWGSGPRPGRKTIMRPSGKVSPATVIEPCVR